MSENLAGLIGGMLCSGLIAVGMLGLGGFLVVYYARSRKLKTIHSAWPSVIGRVLNASIEEGARTRFEDDASYFAQVEFEYQVAGQTYRLKQGVGRAYSWQAKAERHLQRYPFGGQVTVFYNPENPEQARLEQVQQSAGAVWALIVGVFCLLLGGCAACGAAASLAGSFL